jgi:predicted DNA binding CopG/RHH family protein
MKNKKLKKIPKFKTDEEFGEFWMTHDLTDYYDLEKSMVRMQFVKLEGQTESVRLELPDTLIKQIESRAKKEDISLSALMAKYVKEGLAKHRAVR